MRTWMHAYLLTFLFLFFTDATAAIGDRIANVNVKDTSGSFRQNVQFTFGHVFKKGEITAGASVGVRLTDGTLVPSQTNIKATHDDGSLRHAIITIALPFLDVNESKALELFTSQPTESAPPVVLAELLSTDFDSILRLTINGIPYVASARAGLMSSNTKIWLSGPLLSEWITRVPLVDANGAAHPDLMARFHVRSYQYTSSVRVDTVVENSWAYSPDPKNFQYDVSLTVGSAPAYTQTGLVHYHHARWRNTSWWRRAPNVNVSFDKKYIVATGAVPMISSVQQHPK